MRSAREIGKAVANWAWRAVLVAGIIALAAVLTVAIRAFILEIPAMLYVARAPSLELECEKFSPGLSRAGALTILRQAPPPYSLADSPGRLVYWRGHGACVIEFDAASQRVVKSHVDSKLNLDR